MKAHAVPQVPTRCHASLRVLLIGLALLWAQGVGAAVTDLENVPIASAQSSGIKPNIMLMLDAHDSMKATAMPDDLEQVNLDVQSIGYSAYQCNSMYYNPNQSYAVPKLVDGGNPALPLIDAPTPSFTAAPYNYYTPTILSPTNSIPGNSALVDLSQGFQAYDFNTRYGLGSNNANPNVRSDTPQAAYYFQFSIAGTLAYNGAACRAALPVAPATTVNVAGGTWTKVLVPLGQRTNFSIWYTYYRTRIALVKSSVGRAFANLGNNYRVGFITVAPLVAGSPTNPDVPPVPGSAVDPNKYQAIDDFSPAQRQLVYNKLYAQATGGASPSREALARVGRHYSDYGANLNGTSVLRSVGINNGMPEDPVQFSCQRNYSIMLADGYWNKSFETAGSVKMDGSTLVGQQDSPLTGSGVCDGTGNGLGPTQQCAPRPIYDGGTSGNVVDQQQKYDFQALSCSSGNDTQTVTNYTRSVEQYFIDTQSQYRETDTLTYENTQTSKVTTTQTVDQQQLKEVVTHATQTVTQSTQRDTVSKQSLLNVAQVATQVLRNDTQQTIQYQYVMKTVVTATKEVWSQTYSAQQWQQINNDGTTWGYVSACSADTVNTSGCAMSANWATNAPIDPGVNHLGTCVNQSPTLGNNYLTVTCSGISDTGVQPTTWADACIGNSNTLLGNQSRQTCAMVITISYVDPTSCSGSVTPTQIVACGAILTPTLSAGPASGANVASCTPQNLVTANLVVPVVSLPNIAGATNNYQRLCPTVVVAAPSGSTITNAGTQQYLVDPATCAVNNVSVPPSAQSSTNGTGLTTTCTPSIVTTPVPYPNCGGSCADVAATTPNWTATTYSFTSWGPTFVARSVCPATQTVDAVTSPFTETVCTLVSDTSYNVDTASCVAGPTGVAGGITRTCSTAAVSGPTTVPSCSAGFDGTNTTTCATVTDVALHGVTACTYGVGSTVVGNQTYTCGMYSVLGIAVEPGSCTPGPTYDPVTGITITCHAQNVVTTYVPKGGCSPIPAGAGVTTVVACPAVTVGSALGPVPPGFCSTPGAAGGYSSSTTTFSDPAASGTGYTSICTNTHTGWNQEAVGTACSGGVYNPGWGSTWTGTIATNATTQTQTICVMYDSGPSSYGGVCTPGIISGANLTQQTCIMNTITPMGPGVACSSGSYYSGAWYHQTCVPTVVVPSTVVPAATCLAAQATAAAAVPATSSVACAPIQDSWQLQSRYTTNNYTQYLNGTMPIGSPVLTLSVGPTAWANVGACTPTNITPMPVGAIPSVLASAASPVIPPIGLNQTAADGTGLGACNAWPCDLYYPATNTGSWNSLADVAEYYYATDLRASMPNNIPVSPTAGAEDDRATHQHMVTYVVGLGVSGTLAFNSNYRDPSNLYGDFPAIRAGAVVPTAIGATGQINWPVWPTAAVANSSNPAAFTDPRSIDDFWHTAVDGRGQYFSASDASSMVSSIQGALDGIGAAAGTGAGATTTTGAPTATNNSVYETAFKTVAWTGDLQALIFNVGPNTVTTPANTWSAQTALQSMVGPSTDSRNIVFRKSGGSAFVAGSNLSTFTYTNLVIAGYQNYFNASVVPLWSQFGSMDATQIAGAPGANLVNFLRGQRGNENFAVGADTQFYRQRVAVLGDIAGSQPAYVAAPTSSYADTGYGAFQSGAAATRKKMVYVGANDGMLHAFYAPQPTDANWSDAGKEAWAYVPSQVMPNMYKLADVQYSGNHQFFVDGTATVGDVYDGSNWRTILVGGFNDGGQGYYALDITVPDQPKSLWEFTLANDANLGMSFGRPIISKLVNGTWVAMFTSGYNNANGNGYLYIVNAVTGVQTALSPIATGVGSASSPSGLGQINNWVNNIAADNTTQRVYGGDLLGNVWRFDVNTTGTALLLATLTDSSATPAPQPITTRPELAEIGGDSYVYVGTGKLLGLSDFSTTQSQSVYSFKDLGATYPSANVRPTLKPMAFTTTGSTRTIACIGNAAQCAQTTGWVIDLPLPGERMNLDFKVGLGTLAFVTNVPSSNFCSAGESWLNYVDEVSGNQIDVPAPSVGTAGVELDANSLAVGLGMVLNGGGGSGGGGGGVPVASPGPCAMTGIGVSATGAIATECIPAGSSPPQGKRISWREVAQ